MNKSFSQTLKEYKELHSFTNVDMARKLGIGERMYKLYEKGDYDGSASRIKKYTEKLTGNNVEHEINETTLDMFRKYVTTLEQQVKLQADYIVTLKAQLAKSKKQ